MSLRNRDYVNSRVQPTKHSRNRQHRQYTPEQEQEEFAEYWKAYAVFVVVVFVVGLFVIYGLPVLDFVAYFTRSEMNTLLGRE